MPRGLQRLPAEILGEVFDQALEIDITRPRLKTMDQLNEICLVCRDWRNVAVSTHRLWRTFKVSDTFTPGGLQAAEQWLERAKTLSVGLAVRSHTGHKDRCHESGDCSLASPESGLARTLGEGTINIYHLAITCPSSACFYWLLVRFEELRRRPGGVESRCTQRPWDGIQSLKLSIYNDWDQFELFQHPGQDILTSRTYPIFYSLPPITSLTVHLPSFSPTVLSNLALNIPSERLSRLTELHLTSDWYAEVILKVLKSCDRVERLTLDLWDATFLFLLDAEDDLSLGTDANASLLPSVRRLQLWRVDPQALEYLRYFRTPLLEELELGFTPTGLHRRLDQPPFSMEVVAEFLQRSQCSMTLSRVCMYHAPSRDVQHLQNRLPFMKEPYFLAERQGDDFEDEWIISRAP